MAQTDLLIRPAEPDRESSGDSGAQGRTLPSNLEAEAAFLGAALIDNRVIEDLQTPIRPEHFFEPLHQRKIGRASCRERV